MFLTFLTVPDRAQPNDKVSVRERKRARNREYNRAYRERKKMKILAGETVDVAPDVAERRRACVRERVKRYRERKKHSMDFERINVDADKTSDSTGDPEDGKQLVDPLEFVEVKTEVKEEPLEVVTIKDELIEEIKTEEYAELAEQLVL